MKAIASFDAHTSDDKGPTTSYYSSKSAETTYLLDVATRHAHERRNIRFGVVCMVNDTKILVVSQDGDNAIQVAPQYVMMDLGAQLVMIRKRLA